MYTLTQSNPTGTGMMSLYIYVYVYAIYMLQFIHTGTVLYLHK